jgi:hypothetical protein
MLAMDDAQTTLVIPSLIRSDMEDPPQGMKKAPNDGADKGGGVGQMTRLATVTLVVDE